MFYDSHVNNYDAPFSAQNRETDAVDVLEMIYNSNNKKALFAYPVKFITPETCGVAAVGRSFCKVFWHQVAPLFHPPLLLHTIKASFVMFVVFSISSGFYVS